MSASSFLPLQNLSHGQTLCSLNFMVFFVASRSLKITDGSTFRWNLILWLLSNLSLPITLIVFLDDSVIGGVLASRLYWIFLSSFLIHSENEIDVRFFVVNLGRTITTFTYFNFIPIDIKNYYLKNIIYLPFIDFDTLSWFWYSYLIFLYINILF